jgi:hypothetical protein
MIGRHRTWTQAEVMSWIEEQPSCRMAPRGIAKANKAKAEGKAA